MPKLHPLGRRVPSDWKHREKYPYSAVAPRTVTRVEKTLPLPRYRADYNQESEGACVGFAGSWMMSILNRRFYHARWLWNEAKKIDEWTYTNPGDNSGTSVRAAMDILRKTGHSRRFAGKFLPPALPEGIQENRWATSVDEIRTAISKGNPVTFGINWYVNFDTPKRRGNFWWIGEGELGRVRGGHAVCIYGAADSMDAVAIVNNWGTTYPLVRMPYATVERLLEEEGEATLVTDRV